MRCGAILTIKNRSGHTAFQAGAAMGYIELAKKLDRCGTKRSSKTCCRFTFTLL